MKIKKKWYIIGGAALLLLLVVFGVVAAWYLGAFDPPLVRYAPAEADMIVYVNCRKIALHKVIGSLAENSEIKAALEKARQKSEIPARDLLNSELCVFANTGSSGDSARKGCLTVLCRFHKLTGGVPKEVLNTNFHKRLLDGDSESTTIGGKPARVARRGRGRAAVVALDHRLMQYSVVPDDRTDFRLLAKGKPTDLAELVDTDAMFSAVIRVGAGNHKEINEFVLDHVGVELPEDLTLATVGLRESGDDLVLEAVLKFKRPESAKTVEEALKNELAEIAENNQDPTVKKLLKDIKISRDGGKLAVTLAESSDEIIRIVNSAAVVKYICALAAAKQ